MSDTAERVKKIVVEHLNVDADKVVESASFIEDLGADSLDTVELVMAFEEEFGIEIPDDAAESIVTVGDAVKYIDKANAWPAGCAGSSLQVWVWSHRSPVAWRRPGRHCWRPSPAPAPSPSSAPTTWRPRSPARCPRAMAPMAASTLIYGD